MADCLPMLHVLPATLRGAVVAAILGLSTVVGVLAMVLPALLKLLVPLDAVRSVCDRALTDIASAWVACNNTWIAAVNPSARWDVQGVAGLHRRGWYLVSPNHQSWVDILVLQRVFHGRIPFLKFFLKQELIWVPVIGLAWWALDFPFMKRGRSAGATMSDLAATRAACEKFKRVPTTVINFVEGTRFTPAKHAAQHSPYRHLLKPKVGALSLALATMGDQFEAMLDVTLVYPRGVPTFWDLLSGRLDAVMVRVHPRPIPGDLVVGDPQADPELRARTAAWIEQQWSEKDVLIDTALAGSG